ncbi:MAG: UPF0104 family protein [Calditrichaeota bacterium]|nr:MAG: UPF0104 family protein [Calditrichota bacterium]
MKKNLTLALKIVVSLLLFGWIFTNYEFKNFTKTLLEVEPFWILLTLLLIIPNFFFQFVKWKMLVDSSGTETTFFTASKSVLCGKFLTLFVPGGAGELGRGLFVKNASKVELTKLAVFDKVQNFSVVLCLGGFSYFYLMTDLSFNLKISLLIFCSILPLFLSFGFFKALKYTRKLKEIGSKELLNLEELSKFDIAFHLKTYVLAFLFHGTYIVQFAFLVLAFGKKGNFPDLLSASIFSNLLKLLLPISFGNFGIREITAIFGFNLIGVSAEAATTGSFILFFLNNFLPGILGILLFAPEFFSKRKANLSKS